MIQATSPRLQLKRSLSEARHVLSLVALLRQDDAGRDLSKGKRQTLLLLQEKLTLALKTPDIEIITTIIAETDRCIEKMGLEAKNFILGALPS